MHIRRLTLGDEAFALHAAHTFKGRYPDLAHAEDFLADPHNVLLVATEEETPVGFALAYRLERWERTQPMMFLYEIEVLATHQRRGIGGALMEALLAECRQAHCYKLFLLTNASNTAALAFYAASGGQRPNSDDVLICYPQSAITKITNPKSIGGMHDD